MSYQFNISEMGLRLIKAYEGFVPDGRLMRDGRRIVGYGRVTSDLDMVVTKSDAESMLNEDLAAIQDMINTNVHASMTQSQFDALCSLAYSIGPKAFLNSSVLHAMNRGEVIAAANGFDGWRLGNIDGQIYVVDALVRRRTAEKALFLRPTLRTVPAPHEALKALQDDTTIEENVANLSNVVRTETTVTSNVVPLYQKGDVSNQDQDVVQEADTEDEILTLENHGPDSFISPIAEAAADVSDRLDALMDQDTKSSLEEWPDSLVEEEAAPIIFSNDESDTEFVELLDETEPSHETVIYEEPESTILDGYGNDGRYASADKYIQPGMSTARQNLWTFITMIIIGLSAAIGGFWANMKASMFFGDLSPLIWIVGVALGVLLFLMGLYYLAKHLFGRG